MKNHQAQQPTGPVFQRLILSTVVAIFALVVLGGVVRVTGSGLGCPDWPLCHGKVIPPMDTQTLIEYSHRLAASIVGILVLATALVAWCLYRKNLLVLVSATLCLILVVVQGVLGGVTVLTELEGRFVIAHLALAEAILATMILAFLATRGDFCFARAFSGRELGAFAILVPVTALAAYVLLLSGSYTTVSGASGACGGDWPLCQGQFWPAYRLPQLQMIHRFGSLIVAVLILWTSSLAWRRRRERPDLGWMGLVVAGLFIVQVLIGALNVWLDLPSVGRALHLTLATMVWMTLAVLALLPYTSVLPDSRVAELEGDHLTKLRPAA